MSQSHVQLSMMYSCWQYYQKIVTGSLYWHTQWHIFWMHSTYIESPHMKLIWLLWFSLQICKYDIDQSISREMSGNIKTGMLTIGMWHVPPSLPRVCCSSVFVFLLWVNTQTSWANTWLYSMWPTPYSSYVHNLLPVILISIQFHRLCFRSH